MTTEKQLLKRYGIALTGGIGTGKSTVAKMLSQLGLPVIDADELARGVTAKGTSGLKAVVKEFGPEILTASGELDRKRLGSIVFKDAEKRHRLEAITHPLIRAALFERLQSLGIIDKPRPFVYEAALIVERGLDKDFNQTWATLCSREQQIERVMRRDGVDHDRAAAIIASQLDAKAKADKADQVIDTSRTVADVEAQIKDLVASL